MCLRVCVYTRNAWQCNELKSTLFVSHNKFGRLVVQTFLESLTFSLVLWHRHVYTFAQRWASLILQLLWLLLCSFCVWMWCRPNATGYNPIALRWVTKLAKAGECKTTDISLLELFSLLLFLFSLLLLLLSSLTSIRLLNSRILKV